GAPNPSPPSRPASSRRIPSRRLPATKGRTLSCPRPYRIQEPRSWSCFENVLQVNGQAAQAAWIVVRMERDAQTGAIDRHAGRTDRPNIVPLLLKLQGRRHGESVITQDYRHDLIATRDAHVESLELGSKPLGVFAHCLPARLVLLDPRQRRLP